MKDSKLQFPLGLYHTQSGAGFHARWLGPLGIKAKFASISNYLPEHLVNNKHLLGSVHSVHALRGASIATDERMRDTLNHCCFNMEYYVENQKVKYDDLVNAIRFSDITKDWQEFSWGLLVNYGQGDYIKVFLDWAKKDISHLMFLSRKTKKYSVYELSFPEDTFSELKDSFEEHYKNGSYNLSQADHQAINTYLKAWEQFYANKDKKNQYI